MKTIKGVSNANSTFEIGAPLGTTLTPFSSTMASACFDKLPSRCITSEVCNFNPIMDFIYG